MHSPSTEAPPAANDENKEQQLIYRENLVVLDDANNLYHVVVKGMHVRDGKAVKTQVNAM